MLFSGLTNKDVQRVLKYGATGRPAYKQFLTDIYHYIKDNAPPEQVLNESPYTAEELAK